MPGVPVKYEVSVKDKEDSENIDKSNIFVSVDYMEGMDGASVARGHQDVNASIMGKMLTETLDCRSCHKMGEKSIGPSYMQVSERYKDDENKYTYLSHKIINGGGGVWGEVMMPAHPTLTEVETHQIIEYISSLTDDSAKTKSLPPSGTITAQKTEAGNAMVIVASYTDKGTDTNKPLTGTAQLILSSSIMSIPDDLKKKVSLQWITMETKSCSHHKKWAGLLCQGRSYRGGES